MPSSDHGHPDVIATSCPSLAKSSTIRGNFFVPLNIFFRLNRFICPTVRRSICYNPNFSPNGHKLCSLGYLSGIAWALSGLALKVRLYMEQQSKFELGTPKSVSLPLPGTVQSANASWDKSSGRQDAPAPPPVWTRYIDSRLRQFCAR